LPSFSHLGVPAHLTDALARQGIHHPTPIQAGALPDALAGRDVLGRGRTGSGKTYAFLLPVVARLSHGPKAGSTAPRALILAPTRELVRQIDTALAPLAHAAGLRTGTVIGGVGQNPQVAALRRGVDVVVATPGRLEDLIGQGHCSLGDIEITVLDEADHMSDLGFLPATRRLLSQTPRSSQRLLFSATLDRAVHQLVRQYLTDPVAHEVDPMGASSKGNATHHVLHLEREHRLAILVDLASAPGRTVVFTRTKHGAKALTRQLNRSGVPAVELHGNLSQNARTRNLDAFHAGRASTLVATDIAARGIHVDDVSLVVHADPPNEHKAYLHRSGRTARAGNPGTVVTLATPEQVRDVRGLTKAAGIAATTTRIQNVNHPLLQGLAPGERVLSGPLQSDTTAPAPARSTATSAPRGRNRPRRQKSRADGSRPVASTPQGPTTSRQAPRGDRPARRTAGGKQASSSAGGRRHSAAAFSASRR
jgi:superfamily II DNA/RNA helicase